MSTTSKHLVDLSTGIEQIVSRLSAGKSFVPLIGAGVSFDAGIPMGAGVVKLLKARFPDRLPRADYEYVEAFNEALPGPEHGLERRKFFESICAGKTPQAQTFLVAHLIEHGLFRVVLTTNFDHLIEQALVACSSQPIHIYIEEDSYYPATSIPKCPTILKIHGDFLFDNIANLEAEMKHMLSDSMQSKLIDSTRTSDLLVMGYSG